MMDDLIFKTTPWEHQLLAVKFLIAHKQAALYTDMGTGKSKVMIDLIVNKGFHTVLIVCTKKGCEVWEKQFALHSNILSKSIFNLSGMPTVKKVQVLSQNMSQTRIWSITGPFIILVNYEGVWRGDFAKYLLRKSVKIDCVICDESHRIKSPSSKCSRFLAQIGKKAEYRYLVTGTPIAENPMDVYAQYRFLDPSIFGTSFSKFKDRYQNLDTKASMAVGYPILDKQQPYKNLEELREKVFSIAFRIPSSIKLPKRNNRIQHFRMSDRSSKVYKKMCKEGIVKNGEWYCEAENALTLQIRKTQITSGFLNTVNETNRKRIFSIDHSRKEVLMDILGSLMPSESVVVFARYVYDLDEIKDAVEALGRKYSELSGREDTEKDWQSGESSVLGVQFSKGSESADFTRARYTIYYTMTNRLALYLQSKKRTHRPGQTRPCYYIHLVADTADGKPTIDNLIMDAIKQKKDIVEYIMQNDMENTCLEE